MPQYLSPKPNVEQPAAITVPPVAAAAPTKAEYDALRASVLAIRDALVALGHIAA